MLITSTCAHYFARKWPSKILDLAGIKPITSWSPLGCASDWATEPSLLLQRYFHKMRENINWDVCPSMIQTGLCIQSVQSAVWLKKPWFISYLNSFQWSLIKCQGPVVQSVVSLTSSLRIISLTVLADSIYYILIFFAEKLWVAFALQKLLTFFQQKISAYLHITRCKF